MPEWYLVVTLLAALSVLGSLWSPLLAVAMPLLGLAVTASIGQAVLGGVAASFADPSASGLGRARARALVALLHLVQPAARLWGRVRDGLTPWRQRGAGLLALPHPRTETLWSERWTSAEARIASIEAALQDLNATTRRGSDFDRWDLEVRGGLLGSARVRMVIEEHGAGRQVIRVGLWPRCALGVLIGGALFGVLGGSAAQSGAWAASVMLGAGAGLLILRAMYECSVAMGSALRAVGHAGIGLAILGRRDRLTTAHRTQEAERPRG
jgi:hypothetical protein